MLACLVFACAVSAAEASPLMWSSAMVPVDNVGAGQLAAASCPTLAFCVGIDRAGNRFFTRDPAGGPAAWSARRVLPRAEAWAELADIDCPATNLCVATGDGGLLLTTTEPEHGPWTVIRVGTDRLTVDCASPTLCVAASHSESELFVSTNPTGGVSAWVDSKPTPSVQLFDVTCPSTTLCVGVGSGNEILSSTNPTGGPGAWKVVRPQGNLHTLFKIACPSASRCTATDRAGRVVTSTNPAGPAEAWTIEGLDNSNDHWVVCATEATCLLSETANGYLYTSTATGWRREAVTPFRVLTCVGLALCLGSDRDHVLTTSDPAAGAAAWKRTRFTGIGEHAVYGVACPSAGFCLAVDGDGRVLTSSAPADARQDWTVEADLTALGADALTAIACASRCFAGDADGGLFVRDTAGRWTRSAEPTGRVVWSIACTSERDCLAVDDDGVARRFDGTRWQAEHVADGALYGVACPQAGSCVAVDEDGNAHVTRDGGWTTRVVSNDRVLLAVACPSPTLCVATDDEGSLHVTLGPDRSWRERPLDADALTAVTCPSAALCVATDASGGIYTAADPIRGTWERFEYAYGVLTAVACAGDALCVAVNENGYGFAATATGAPFNTAPPTITRSGDTLTCDPGVWTGQPVLGFGWEADGRDTVPGASGSTLTVTATTAGVPLNCRVTAGESVARSGTRTLDLAPRVVTLNPPRVVFENPPPPRLPPFSALVTAKAPRLTTLLSRGLPVTLSCSLDCGLTVRLVPDGATARRLGLKRGAAIGSTVRAALVGGRKTTVRVQLTAGAQRAIKRKRVSSIRFAVRAEETGKRPVAGGGTLTVRR